jgi:hypothetical protein
MGTTPFVLEEPLVSTIMVFIGLLPRWAVMIGGGKRKDAITGSSVLFIHVGSLANLGCHHGSLSILPIDTEIKHDPNIHTHQWLEMCLAM